MCAGKPWGKGSALKTGCHLRLIADHPLSFACLHCHVQIANEINARRIHDEYDVFSGEQPLVGPRKQD
jgi:hypothetical protein